MKLNREELTDFVAQQITNGCDLLGGNNDILSFFKEKQEEFLNSMDEKELIDYVKEYDLAEIDDYLE